MDDEQPTTRSNRLLYHRQRGVHGGKHTLDRAVVLELEAVHRAGIILDLGKPQLRI